jgi:uncharacterized protein
MTGRNIEVVRAVIAAFNRADYAAALELCDPQVEFDWSQRLLDPEILHGREGVRRFFGDTAELFDEIRIEEEEMIDLGDEVLMVGNAHFKGHTSGASVEARAANLWTVRDGKVTRFRFFQNKEDALEATRTPQVGRD